MAPTVSAQIEHDTASETEVELLLKCLSHLNDSVLITEAEPLDLPGPRIIFVNDAFLRQTGYAREEVIGQTPRMLQGLNTDRGELRRMKAAFQKWEPVRAELVNYTKDGSEFVVEMDIVPVANATGWFTHWVSIQRDVTRRKQEEAEAAIKNVERAESLGKLASGIAHDFNNIVSAILGNVVIAEQEMADGKTPDASLRQIKKAGERARELVQQILAHSRRQSHEFSQQSVRALMSEASLLWRATMPTGVELRIELPAVEISVQGDATQLQQVLLNLGINAFHALPPSGGRLAVTSRIVDVEQSDERNDASGQRLTAGQYVAIEFADNGHGMDEATLRRIFEPYFTTKQPGQGTGLGLSLVWGIVAAHGGRIDARSDVGVGSVFTLMLPVFRSTSSPAAIAPIQTRRPHGQGQHVLCVDDDEVILLMMEGLLCHQGFRVTMFTSAIAAVAAVRANPREFDVVVTDFNMPELSGLDVAREIGLIDKTLPVLLCSGYLSEELSAAALNVGVSGVFNKEFAGERLSLAVQDIMAGSARETA